MNADSLGYLLIICLLGNRGKALHPLAFGHDRGSRSPFFQSPILIA